MDRRAECTYSQEVSRFIHLHHPDVDSKVRSSPTPPQEYPAPHQRENVVLSIRSARESACGNGVYHTFVPMKTTKAARTIRNARKSRALEQAENASLTRPVSADKVTLLASEFAHVCNASSDAGMRWTLLGRWLDCLPARLGRSPLLDQAAACVISGHKARFAKDKQAAQISRQRYGSALLSLHNVLESGREAVTVEVIAATRLLMTFE